MSQECMLCQVKRAETPYYIKCVGLRVYTIEELLYFMSHNLPLLDEEILNGELVRWIKEELRMRRLSLSLSLLLQRRYTVKEFVLPIFKEVHYPSDEEIKKIQNELGKLEELSHPVRMKQKADLLAGHQRYLKAIECYEKILESNKTSALPSQLLGGIYHNRGCCYARLFQMEEMCSSFYKANQILQTMESMKDYLAAVYLKDGKSVFEEEAAGKGMDFNTTKKLEEELSGIVPPNQPEFPTEAIRQWVIEYHKNTGL